MGARVWTFVAVACLVAGGTVGARATATPVATGLPDGVPPAALRAEPALPVPHGWPFADAFPRTSGTGRLVPGAFEWSDFLYDDHGAKGHQVAASVTSLAAPAGTYVYPSGPANMNGADIFRTAIGSTGAATWWRVDWNTLVDPNVPVAEFALDTDNNSRTGVAAWPGGAGVRSAGIDKALILSARGAWLVDAATGHRRSLGAPIVDLAARSFLLAVPRALLDPQGTWRVRLAAGLANATGDGFQSVPLTDGAGAGQPAVYNVTFRSSSQESAASNYWMDRAQASALAAGDVSGFAATVAWPDLAGGRTTPEPQPTGYSNRWYVSSLDLGQGVTTKSNPNGLTMNFLGRVQPYAIYVPTHYASAGSVPLTWMLHSLDENHNQYGALNPRFVTAACEARKSICVTTLGRGPGGWYYDEAEVDFWEVWNRVAAAYRVDPERTVLSGYSMGGWGTYKLGLAHPDLFSKAVVLEGATVCGTRPLPGLPLHAGPGHCATDGDSVPLIDSARNLPYVISQGALDELAPLTGAMLDVQRFQDLGYRLRLELYPTADHLAYPTFDDFTEQAAQMDGARRVHNPTQVTYAWAPALDRADLGIGATGAYWIGALKARAVAPGSVARVDAISNALPDPTMSVVTKTTFLGGSPFPGIAIDQQWVLGAPATLRPVIVLTFSNVAHAAVDLARAGIRGAGKLDVTTDGPVTLHLVGAAGPDLTVTSGRHIVTFR